VDTETIKAKAYDGTWVVSADIGQEADDENIDIAEIRDAVLGDEILAQCADAGRGPSCLLLGFVKGRPVHVVCGWRGEAAVDHHCLYPKAAQV
jgi:hypothetical protein